ncbi:hypothetical protein Tco_1507947 [Tanacetum coccineum]
MHVLARRHHAERESVRGHTIEYLTAETCGRHSAIFRVCKNAHMEGKGWSGGLDGRQVVHYSWGYVGENRQMEISIPASSVREACGCEENRGEREGRVERTEDSASMP